MKKNIDKGSLFSRGLKYKLKVSFYLILILPFLICLYLVSIYIFPKLGFKLDVVVSIAVNILISLAGFFVIKEVFDRVVTVSSKAKIVASGDLSYEFDATSPDEVGDLSKVLNQLTQRIRSNMEELKTYGDRTTEINLSIQKRVLVLSNLLQINSFISQGSKIEDIFGLAAEKMRLLANSEISFIFFEDEDQDTFRLKAADGANSDKLAVVNIDPERHFFGELLKRNASLAVDKANPLPVKADKASYDQFGFRNILVSPVCLKGRVVALLGIGNNKEDFSYAKDEAELLDIFSKQVAIAIENNTLLSRVEKLEIKDSLTGLYNEKFIHGRLQEEIKRAIKYHRPCSYILLNIDNFKDFHRSFGLMQAEEALKKIGSLVLDGVTEVDRAGRVGDNEFAVILPEKNKRQAREIAEQIRKSIEFIFSEDPDVSKRFTVSAGISENPLDGIAPQDLINKAKESLKSAKAEGKNKIVS